jgi:hypothetical protein
MRTVEQVAAYNCVDPADVRVLLAQLGHHGDDVDKATGCEITDILQPHMERTVPQAYGARGEDV